MESITNCCRLCLGEEGVDYDLFNAENESQSYFYQIFEMFGIELNNMDQWPSNGCVNCIRILDKFAVLKAQIVSTQEELLKKLPHVKDEYEPPELVECMVEDIEYPSNPFDYEMKEDVPEVQSSSQAESNEDNYELSGYYDPIETTFDEEVDTDGEDSSAFPSVSKGRGTIGKYGPKFVKLTEAEISSKEQRIRDTDERLRSLNLLLCSVCQLDLPSFRDLKYHMSVTHAIKLEYVTCCDRKYRFTTPYEHKRFQLHASSHQGKDGEESNSPDGSEMKNPFVADKGEGSSSGGRKKSQSKGTTKEVLASASPVDTPHGGEKVKRTREPIEDSDQLESLMKDMGLLKCYVCQEDHSSYQDLKRHQMHIHALAQGAINCCERKFVHKKAYEHMRYHQDQDLFKCTTCEKRFMCKIDLENHLSFNHVPEDKALFRCEQCGRGFTKTKFFDIHVLQHKNRAYRKPTCSHCAEICSSQAALETHVEEMHPGEHMYVCEFCGKGFQKKYNYDHHLKVQHRERTTEECDICGRHMFNLVAHKRIAHSTTLFPCEVCGLEFTKPRLGVHKRKVHRKQDVLFKCKTCGKEFTSAKAFHNHNNMHLGKTYDCHFCPVTNKDSGNLVKHMRQVHAVEYEEFRARKHKTPRVKNASST